MPYRAMMRSSALWAAIFSLVCHEYPLVIMLQFLPNYMRDVLEFAPTKNGLIAALPILCLFLSKTVCSSFSSYLVTKRQHDKTFVCKVSSPRPPPSPFSASMRPPQPASPSASSSCPSSTRTTPSWPLSPSVGPCALQVPPAPLEAQPSRDAYSRSDHRSGAARSSVFGHRHRLVFLRRCLVQYRE